MVYTGFWDVPEESSPIKKKLHKFYIRFTLTYLWLFTLMQCIEIVRIGMINFDVKKIIDISYITIVGINFNIKLMIMQYMKEKINEIRNTYLSKLLRPNNKRQLDLESETEKFLEYVYFVF